MGVHRKTRNLELVLDAFRNAQEALSAQLLMERLPADVNRSTIYRLLDRLEDDGVVHSFLASENAKFYALCKECTQSGHVHSHAHFQCTSCSQVVCLEQQVAVPTLNQYRVDEAQVLLKGQCATCMR
ncbi:MAG: transcriptional repressor [Bacteroidota bacterium]|nr:transcriptional repressor [Bacteroidota bacterium]MEE3164504.1 transcriptional repressor [Bacteroidota bacterium]